MNRFPRYVFPFQYYNPYRKNNTYHYNPIIAKHIVEGVPKSETSSKESSQKDNVWLDLFGIKLYFDDILIISLLFFLYQEEVKDEGLFLALVMLLIS